MTKKESKISKDCMHGTTFKRKKSRNQHKKKKSRDQLSNLPMDILSSIISQLPIKEAIRTTVLSSHWKYVWRQHTKLNLNFDTVMPSHGMTYKIYPGMRLDQQMFIKRVDDVLMQHSGVGVEQININSDLHDIHTADVNRWVNFAIASKTKELSLELIYQPPGWLNKNPDGVEPYSFPFKLFDASKGSHLQFLLVTLISMKLPADFEGFINLKKLCLEDVNINDEDLQHLLSKCTLLEFLGMTYCKMITSLRVPLSASHLKHLEVDSCSLLREITLNNGLTILQYRGDMVSFVSSDTSRLTNVRIKLINLDSSVEYLFTEFPGTKPPLKTLTSNLGGLERAISSRRLPKFVYLQNLVLELDLNGPQEKERETDLLDVVYILQAAPFIEMLKLH